MLAISRILIFFYLLNSVELFTFDDAHSDGITFGNLSSGTQTLYMEENNAEGVTLVLITGATSEPTIGNFIDGTAADLGATIQKADTDYKIVINKQVNYEALSGPSKRFLFRVSDGSTQQMINLVIVNVDDNPPSISTTNCAMNENTTYTIEDAPCSFRVTDVDGFLNKMTFTIIPSNKNEDKIFVFQYKTAPSDDVHEADVYLTLQTGQILDFEQIALYVFTLQAQDSAGHPTTPIADISVLVQVVDIPDENPVWQSLVSLRSFPEEEETTFTVQAKDGDYSINAEINYSVQDPNNFTTIDSKTGEVKIGKVDREAGFDSISLTITAYEAEDTSSSITQDLTFIVSDINDNIPKITINNSDNKTIEIAIDENYFDKLNVDINIYDPDLGANAMYTVRLVDEDNSDFTSAFQVIPTKGYQSLDFYISVASNSKLDYEDPDWRIIKFTLEAYDDNDQAMRDAAAVTILLNDLNDEYPIFEKEDGSYTVSVPENIKINQLVATVYATDKDAGDVVTHSLLGDRTNSILTINPTTGEIQTKRDHSFDYEKQSEVFVQVLAVDTAKHRTTAELTITITDINDEPPTVSVTSTSTIQENRKDGYEIPDLGITASDVDTTASLEFSINWDESYATKNSIKINSSIFAEYHCINVETIPDPNTNKKASAKLTIAETKTDNTPDFETFDTLYLLLQVTDKNTEENEKTASTTIVIKIENINDNPPEFSLDTIQIKRSVTENSDIGINVGTIIASDPDNLQDLFYSIESTDDVTKDWITIDQSGSLSVSGNIDCDDPKRDNINYSITAFDGDFSTTVQITIDILDQNDNSPVMNPIDVSIPEHSPANTPIYKLNATDKDRDKSFRTVTYSFQSIDSSDNIRNNFAITRDDVDDTYQLSVATTANIDRETGPQSYEFIIVCTDNPDNIGTTTNPVNVKTTITITDINDNTPYVTTRTIPAIKENVSKGATYKDVIEGADLDGPGYFSDIDFVITKIQRFSDPQYTTDITGNLSQSLFSLTTDEKHESQKATLHINDNLVGLYGYYQLTIQTNDFDENGQPENYKTDNIVALEVKKYNFQKPTFIYPENDGDVIYLSKQQTTDTQLWLWNHRDKLHNIEATDHQNDKYNIQFTLDFDNEEDNIFTLMDGVGRSQAQLQLKSSDVNEHHQYAVKITANVDPDNSPETNENSYTVTRRVKFQFIDLDSEPIFQQTETTIHFTENEGGLDEQQSIPEAVYDDAVNISRAIYYILLSEDDYQYFNVDQTNGLVTLTTTLDYEDRQTLTITIQASNSDQINPNSDDKTRLKVTINVIDVNDNAPIFNADSYHGGIQTTYPIQTVILQIQASDADVQDILKYQIDADSIKKSDDSLSTVTDPFSLSEISGGVELRLNFVVQTNMKGYFTFTVNVQDQREPIHTTRTAVEVFIVSDDNVVNFKFENPLTQVQSQIDDIKTILTKQFGNYDCVTETPTPDTTDGIQLDNQTIVPVYFVDNNTKQPIDRDEILSQVSDISVFSNLRATFLEKRLILQSFGATTVANDDVESILRTWLIAVSVCLGTLCLVLVVVLFLKTRSLNRRINNLSSTKFGSQESGLNRQGIAAPTTNKHAVEGSNPVYNNEIDTKEIDRESIRSGDSELIGVEELPEFNYNAPEKQDGLIF